MGERGNRRILNDAVARSRHLHYTRRAAFRFAERELGKGGGRSNECIGIMQILIRSGGKLIKLAKGRLLFAEEEGEAGCTEKLSDDSTALQRAIRVAQE